MSSGNTLQLLRENLTLIVTSTTTITDTSWHHVAATKSGNGTTAGSTVLYIDGVDVTGTIAAHTGLTSSASFLNVGRRLSGLDEFFNGSLDEVAIYPTQLSAARILAHYTAGTAATGAGTRLRILFDTCDYLEYNRTSNYFSFAINCIEEFRILTSGIAALGYARIGSLTAPTNVTAGDFTATRAFIGTDAAIISGLTAQITGALGLSANAALRLYDTDNSSFIAHRANATRTTDLTYVWPATDPTANQVLVSSAPVASVATLSWVAATSVGTHAVLSATHTDSLAGTVTRGDMIVGNSTPAWAEFAIGAAGSILRSDGTDPAWTINPKIAGWMRVGSNTDPTNTTAGDITSARLHLGDDDAFGSETRFRVNVASYVPGAATGRIKTSFVILAPDAASVATFNLAEIFAIRPTASSAATQFFAASYEIFHDTGAFNIGDLVGGYMTIAKTVGGTVTNADLWRGVSVVSAGTVTNWTGLHVIPGGYASWTGGTVTTARGYWLDFTSSSIGSPTVTTFIGLDIEAIPVGTTRFGIRNNNNMVQLGYLRLGAITAPTNVTNGDLTAVRLFVGDAAAVTGVEALITGDAAISGSLMVGASVDPTGTGLQVRGTTTENLQSVDSVRIGVLNGTPRIVWEDAASATLWELDNLAGTLRLYNPAGVRAQWTTAGYLTTGWSRVGAGDPTNVTAGDFTAVRSFIGTDAALLTGLISQVAGALGISGNAVLRLYDTDNSNFIAHRANSTRTTDIIYVWPVTDPTASQVLSSTAPSAGVATLSWSTPLAFSRHTYVNVPDAAQGTTITAGNQQGAILHSGPNDEIADALEVDAETAPGASGLPVTWQYGDTNDLDTVVVWTTIATLTLSSVMSDRTTSMTNATIPANRLIRVNYGTIMGSPADATTTLHVKRPLVA
jgi:hypothetical protein